MYRDFENKYATKQPWKYAHEGLKNRVDMSALVFIIKCSYL